MQRVLVTGAAGFIGFHVCQRMLQQGATVIGVDNVNDYYDVALKRQRLAQLDANAEFNFHETDITDADSLNAICRRQPLDAVIHLAAQVGVRHSVAHPMAFVQSNLVGFATVAEACRRAAVPHLIYASSSSVYGANRRLPYSTQQNVDHPLSLYAATKKANELMAHTYSHLHRLPTTGLRFFTVYGPWGRPDMALFNFTRSILEDRPIDVFNHGLMQRDFTYVDDVVEGILQVVKRIPQPDQEWSAENPSPATSSAPYRIYNIGNHRPVALSYFIEVLEAAIGKKAIRNYLPMQPGDVLETYADVDDLARDTGFRPATPIEVGIERFVQWYRAYYKC